MATRESPLPAFLTHVIDADIPSRELALWYIGGAGYIVRSTHTTVLIDPFLGPGNPPDWVRVDPPPFEVDHLGSLGTIDAVLLTHEHDDHTDPVAPDAIERLTTSPVYGPDTAINVAHSLDLAHDRCHIVTPNQQITIGDLRLTAVAMYDPMAQGCIGWVIESGAVTLLHCGDSLYHAGFAELGQRWDLDAMCVSVGNNPPAVTWYMDEADAARAARDAGVHMLIVQHHDLWAQTQIDPRRVISTTRWYSPGTRVHPARIGKRISIVSASST